jgi:NAD-dependent SIR2 family protein deacetylase
MVSDAGDAEFRQAVAAAAAMIRRADALLVAAGAGMGVDSGLPDFRGEQGFWRAYPALGRQRIAFEDIACPDAFVADPALAWGFYGHRLNLYRKTVPHRGFRTLLEWSATLQHGAFVFTSNVDGHFQRAGFDPARVCEVHGSIHHLQCLDSCSDAIWPADGWLPVVDEGECRLVSPLPRCPACGALARPNILMFGDWGWIGARSTGQHERLAQWLAPASRPVVIEIGAGTQVATVRRFGERFGGALIRINPADARLPAGGGVALACGAAAAIEAIGAALTEGRGG